MATELGGLQNKLWDSVDHLRTHSDLKASEFASPPLGLIYFRYADDNLRHANRLNIRIDIPASSRLLWSSQNNKGDKCVQHELPL